MKTAKRSRLVALVSVGCAAFSLLSCGDGQSSRSDAEDPVAREAEKVDLVRDRDLSERLKRASVANAELAKRHNELARRGVDVKPYQGFLAELTDVYAEVKVGCSNGTLSRRDAEDRFAEISELVSLLSAAFKVRLPPV